MPFRLNNKRAPLGAERYCRGAPRAHYRASSSLKNCFFPVFVAIRTNQVKLGIFFWKILWGVSNASSLSLLHAVVFKLGTGLLLDTVRLQHLRELDLQLRIRQLRVSYLQRQFGQERFHLFIATRLRRLEKSFDPPRDGDEGVRRLEARACELNSVTESIRVHNEILRKAHAELAEILCDFSVHRNTSAKETF